MNRKRSALLIASLLLATAILSANSKAVEGKDLVKRTCQNKLINSIPNSGATLDIMTCSLQNISKEPIDINSFTIRLSGLNNAEDIDRVWLMNDGYARVSETPSFSNNHNTLTLKISQGYERLVAREEVNWTLKASFAGGQLEGRTYLLDILEMDITPAREQEKSWKKFFRWMIW